jgi:hypothetical protein
MGDMAQEAEPEVIFTTHLCTHQVSLTTFSTERDNKV